MSLDLGDKLTLRDMVDLIDDNAVEAINKLLAETKLERIRVAATVLYALGMQYGPTCASKERAREIGEFFGTFLIETMISSYEIRNGRRQVS